MTLRRALDVALAAGHHEQAGRAYTNLAGVHTDRREFAEAERYLADGIAFCHEHDLATCSTCLRGEQSSILERALGRRGRARRGVAGQGPPVAGQPAVRQQEGS